MIYLDNNATTPVDPAVLDAMLPYLRDEFANPSSGYAAGKRVRRAIEHARGQVAELLNCEPEEIVFTSGGTEGDNTALFAATRLMPHRRHLVLGSTEHDAVLRYARWLEREQGYGLTLLPVGRDGRVDPADLDRAIRPDATAAVALMWANNETGVIGPVEEAAAICAAYGVLFFTDAVQAAGKIPVSLRDSGIHFAAISGHKIHAPKGIGALYVSSRSPFHPMIHGGSQENQRRAGTENVPGIVGLGAAAEIARARLNFPAPSAGDPVGAIRDHFETQVLQSIEGVTINGHRERRTPNTCSLCIAGVDAQAMIVLMEQKGFAISAGSACTTGDLTPSHVLTAMGLSAEEARTALRFSFSRFNTLDDAASAAAALQAAVTRFREISTPR